ncbi:MAG: hypothetical protein HC887_03255 [Desulfobacteraceae bacterium]|nr:hypothetical protein [Desulfobacteraceae bacterium]
MNRKKQLFYFVNFPAIRKPGNELPGYYVSSLRDLAGHIPKDSDNMAK